MADDLQQERADAFVAFWNDLLTRVGSRHEQLSGTRRRGRQPATADGGDLGRAQRGEDNRDRSRRPESPSGHGDLGTAAPLTMFGIGAELGIAGVLAAFSNANASDLGHITAALAVIAIVVIVYAGTATRAMADPQPGSSISSQTGASFTL